MFWCRVNGVTAVSKESSSRSRKPEHQNEEGSTSSSAGVMVTAVIIGLGSRFSEVGRYSLMFADFDMI